jgi:NAD(P)H-dependent FMN reductase
MKKIIAFSGSNSSKSINQTLINIVSEYFTSCEVEVLNIRDYRAIVYGIDEEVQDGFPESMVNFKEKMDSADGYLISSPEHNGSMPTALKNTFDWLSRMGTKILQEKPVVFLAASPGARGGASVLKHLTEIMPFRGAKIVGSHGVGEFASKISDGKLISEDDKTKIMSLVRALEIEVQ